jgi:NAD(P)-dependent dehydrogenase (short-subunit alcohol dehydrogenase family)
MGIEMSGLLNGKRAYVTGGSSGIGAAIVKTFAAEGAQVAIGASSHAKEAEALAKSLPGGGHVVVKADLTDRKQIAKAAEDVVQGLGGLDIFVHSAGIDVTQTAVTHETPEATWDNMIDLHLNAAFFLSRALIPSMLKGNKPAMVFIGSVCGLVAWEGDVAYNVAKAGLQHLARCIASDYAKQGLRANVIAPGVIDTPLTRKYAAGMPGGEAEGLKVLAAMHPIGRYAVPNEIADAAAFLASDKASFITGTVLPIDGGLVNV